MQGRKTQRLKNVLYCQMLASCLYKNGSQYDIRTPYYNHAPELVGLVPEQVAVPLCLTVAVPGEPAVEEIEVGEEEEAEEEISVGSKIVATPDELVGEEADEVPEEPPAALDNSANPIDPGLDRKTEYTFFYNRY